MVEEGVDADNFAGGEEEGAAGVAGVDGGVGLQHPGEGAGVVAGGGDDAAGDGGVAGHTEGVADGDDIAAGHNGVGGVEVEFGELAAADFEDSQVAGDVEADDGSRIGLVVVDADGDAGAAFDDVVVGED